MILYRQVGCNYPFLWSTPDQPPSRWHGEGEGPVHYFAMTPDGAWAEFIRHAEIGLDELQFVRRDMWVIDIGGEIQIERVDSPGVNEWLNSADYAPCQHFARHLRAQGKAQAIATRSAAIRNVTGLVQGGDVIGPPRPAWTVTVFVPLPDAVGWQTRGGSPPAYLTGVIPIRRRPLVG